MKNILSIFPYRVLPPKSGGQHAITQLHHYIGLLCTDHVAGTENNDTNNPFSFKMHVVFPASSKRYIPFANTAALTKLAKENNIGYIICEHPYMAPSVMSVANKLGIPWFIRSHNIESERFRQLGKSWWPLLRAFESHYMKKADGILFITGEDAEWARKHFGLAEERCHFIPFGTNMLQKPEPTPRKYDKPAIYFLGALDYAPNAEAVSFILNEIIPRLNAKKQDYQIIIGGKGLPEALQQQIAATEHISYPGFIEDLDAFIKSCDIMLNPMLSGGGVKTKAIEALGYNKQVISTVNGAAGILPVACGNNLHISPDGDWDAFTDNIIAAINKPSDIPQAFYDTYYGGNIAKKVLGILKSTP